MTIRKIKWYQKYWWAMLIAGLLIGKTAHALVPVTTCQWPNTCLVLGR